MEGIPFGVLFAIKARESALAALGGGICRASRERAPIGYRQILEPIFAPKRAVVRSLRVLREWFLARSASAKQKSHTLVGAN